MKLLTRARRRAAYTVLVGAVVRFQGRLWTIVDAEFTSLTLASVGSPHGMRCIHVGELQMDADRDAYL